MPNQPISRTQRTPRADARTRRTIDQLAQLSEDDVAGTIETEVLDTTYIDVRLIRFELYYDNTNRPDVLTAEGYMLYNQATQTMQYCDGATWIDL